MERCVQWQRAAVFAPASDPIQYVPPRKKRKRERERERSNSPKFVPVKDIRLGETERYAVTDGLEL